MPLSALGAVSAPVAATGYLAPNVGHTNALADTPGTGFGQSLAGAINNLQSVQDRSKDLAVQAVTGDLDDIHDYTVAAAESKVTLELTVAIRNKAVEAFNEVMRMQA